MILNTRFPPQGNLISTLEILAEVGHPIVTSGRETLVSVKPTSEAERTSWGEIIHLRHHPGRSISVFADSLSQAIEILAYEFHLWEVKQSIRVFKSRSMTIPQ